LPRDTSCRKKGSSKSIFLSMPPHRHENFSHKLKEGLFQNRFVWRLVLIHCASYEKVLAFTFIWYRIEKWEISLHFGGRYNRR
jgi:hypothetical protein